MNFLSSAFPGRPDNVPRLSINQHGKIRPSAPGVEDPAAPAPHDRVMAQRAKNNRSAARMLFLAGYQERDTTRSRIKESTPFLDGQRRIMEQAQKPFINDGLRLSKQGDDKATMLEYLGRHLMQDRKSTNNLLVPPLVLRELFQPLSQFSNCIFLLREQPLRDKHHHLMSFYRVQNGV